MKLKTLFVLFFALIAGALNITAQQPAARPAAGAATSASAPADAKIAVIYTELFVDQKNGIQRLVNTATGVEREFQPRYTELQNLQRSIQQAEENLQKVAAVQEEAKTRAESARIEDLKRDFTRKREDAEVAFTKRRTDVLAPLSENINTALQAFAKQRGISLLIDGSKFVGGMIVLDNKVDITNEFIADFNRRNPATASAATPARP
jgi:Skp family chaperone for outer membrane proteins